LANLFVKNYFSLPSKFATFVLDLRKAFVSTGVPLFSVNVEVWDFVLKYIETSSGQVNNKEYQSA
jgi:hypothetical protein